MGHPMGDPSIVKDYVETIDRIDLRSGGSNVDLVSMAEEKPSAMITISNRTKAERFY